MENKYMFIGDAHIGRKFRSRDIPLDAKGLREEILFAQFAKLIDKGIEDYKAGKIKGIIQLGDLFDSPNVSYNDLMKVYHVIYKCRQEKVPFNIIAGNHDISKEGARHSAFDVLYEMFNYTSGYIHIWKNGTLGYPSCGGQPDDEVILCPYITEGTAEEHLGNLADKGYIICGHFEEADFPWLKAHFKQVITGHIHSPRKEDNLVVVGSIMPLTFAEDPTNTFMKTCTLAEYETDLADGCSSGRCYRLKLKEGEEMPLNPQCLQMSKYVEEKKQIAEQKLDVDFEPFDIEKMMHDALDTLGLYEEVYQAYLENKMSEIENV